MGDMPTQGGTLARFAGEKYLNLETFRRSGVGVPTPMWFSEEGGVLYLSAPSHTGKVKRIRNDARVRVVPRDSRGVAKGEWLAARAAFVTGEQAARTDHLLAKKYGLQRRMLDLWGKLKRWEYTIIAIRL